MNFAALARRLDAKELPIEAAWAYEIALSSTDVDHTHLLDLVAIYFSFQDLGFAAAHGVDPEVVDFCGQRIPVLLEEASKRFGRTAEIDAWKLYVREQVEAANVEDAEYAALADEGSDLAIVRLQAALGSSIYRDRADALRSQLSKPRTERQRYLKSVLESPILDSGE